MPLSRTSLRSFLSAAKSALNHATKHQSPVTFVIGNESADLDSLCSAVVLAYLRTYSPFSKSNILYIPLSNLPRSDLALRPELLPVLKHANLKPCDLITLSDLTASTNHFPVEQTKWLLVDHNALTGELGRIYSSRVIGCIDHHDDEHKVPSNCDPEPRIVKKSGSCASLVVQYCKPIWNELSKTIGEDERVWNAELARLAIAPVLIDTQNLRDEGKTEESDRRAVRFAEGWIMAAEDGESYSTDEYFGEIQRAKEDIGGLSLRDCLRKDYKEWDEEGAKVGVCSVVRDLGFLLEKAGDKEKFLEVVKKFAGEKELSIVSIMTTSHQDGVFKRELLIWALDGKGVAAAKAFARDAEEKLGLEGWREGELDAEGEEQWRRCWFQTKVQHSRKQVAPLLRASLMSS
ncbi:DHH phosphoesterase [Stipitochalara longipes BDJ]|nr:DHH phosphoesterase [Stipitochalara longipes BDJ]